MSCSCAPYAAKEVPGFKARGRPQKASRVTNALKAKTIPVRSAARSFRLNRPGHHCTEAIYAIESSIKKLKNLGQHLSLPEDSRQLLSELQRAHCRLPIAADDIVRSVEDTKPPGTPQQRQLHNNRNVPPYPGQPTSPLKRPGFLKHSTGESFEQSRALTACVSIRPQTEAANDPRLHVFDLTAFGSLTSQHMKDPSEGVLYVISPSTYKRYCAPALICDCCC